MAILLQNKSEQFYLMSADWGRLLQLAYSYGWTPTGVVALGSSNPMPTPGVAYRPLKEWGGESYALNNFGVEATDAAQMGAALTKSLKVLSTNNTVNRFTDEEILHTGSERKPLPLMLTESGFSYRVRQGSEHYDVEADSEIVFVDAKATIEDYFSGDMKTCVEQFIKFTTHGRFIIFALGREARASSS